MSTPESTVDPTQWDGVVPIDKEPGMTSHDVVARVRRALRPSKIKVGHAGTLDPDATGLLLVCLGSATRLAELLAGQGKTYDARFQLGVSTTTEDASGAALCDNDASHITREMVEEVLAGLTGQIEQVPPMVSAVHHEGKRLYQLARAGIEVERAARTIIVDRITLTEFAPAERHPSGAMTIECGKGTYVRTLCADTGALLGVGGHMTCLRRTRIGAFDIMDALPVGDISAQKLEAHRIGAARAVEFLPQRALSEAERLDVLHGRSVPADNIVGAADQSSWVRLVDAGGTLVALAVQDADGAMLAPKRVLTQTT